MRWTTALSYRMKMNTTAMNAAMPAMLTTKVRVASSSGSYALPIFGCRSSVRRGECRDVGDHVLHRLIVRERHRHRTHQHPGRVFRVGPAHAGLELLQRRELIPVAGTRERRRVERLVALAVRAVAARAD